MPLFRVLFAPTPLTLRLAGLLLIPAALALATGCGGEQRRADDLLRADLAAAAQAPSLRAQVVSPQELGYPVATPYGNGVQYACPPQAVYPQGYPQGYPQPVVYQQAPRVVYVPAPAPARRTRSVSTAGVGSGSGTASGDGAGTGTGSAATTERNTTRGAVIGAATGTAVGILSSRDKVKGGAVGAVAGAVLGGVIGSQIYSKPRP